MLERDIEIEDAEAVFRRKFREKLAARGLRGDALDLKVTELMNSPVRFRFDFSDDKTADDDQIAN